VKWHNLQVEEALSRLGSSRTGLLEEEAVKRLRQYGSNAIREKGKTHPLIIFLRQFANPLIYILLIAVLVEIFIMRKPTDALVILAVLTINAIIGFIQESRAEQAMEALKKLVVPRARVLRGGVISDIAAANLVPGDIILLEAGDKVPADARLTESANRSDSVIKGSVFNIAKN